MLYDTLKLNGCRSPKIGQIYKPEPTRYSACVQDVQELLDHSDDHPKRFSGNLNKNIIQHAPA